MIQISKAIYFFQCY